jgi:hypothetical protein
VQIVGILFVAKDGSASVGKPTVTAADGDPIVLRPRAVVSTDVAPDKIAGNEAFRAMPVVVVDGNEQPSAFVVDDLAPADDVNANFPAALDAQCGPVNLAKPENATVNCCPSAVGPKYFSFTAKEVATGNKVKVQTGNYKDIDFNAWPCSARDLPTTIKVGDTFTTLGGIFDVSFSKASISPGSKSHYVLQRK